MKNNPFNLMYGRIPNESFVNRQTVIDTILNDFNSNNPTTMSYVLTGLRGSGKTVLLRDIVETLDKDPHWYTVSINMGSPIVSSLANKLLFLAQKNRLLLDWKITVNLNIISLTIGRDRRKIDDPEIILEELLRELEDQGIKVLVAIDEVVKTKEIIYFANTYQYLVGKGYNIFLLMTGLIKNILSLFNNKAASFLSRTPKIEISSLEIKDIAEQYKKHLNINLEKAIEYAKITKGYAFAYQVLGYYLFENKCSNLEEVLEKFDNYMFSNGYDVIFNDMSKGEKDYCFAIANSNSDDISSVKKSTTLKDDNFNKYRRILIQKGIIESAGYGKIEFVLPRFKEFLLTLQLYR